MTFRCTSSNADVLRFLFVWASQLLLSGQGSVTLALPMGRPASHQPPATSHRNGNLRVCFFGSRAAAQAWALPES